MTVAVRSIRRPLALAAAAALAVACGSSGGGHKPLVCIPSLASPSGQPFAPSTADCQLAPAVPGGQAATLAGTVTYDFVPATYDPRTHTGGLSFTAAQQRPVRGADVEIRQCSTVLARATTDTAGHYAATFTPGAMGRIYVAVLARTASPPIQVQDNTEGGAIWALAQPLDTAAPTLDVRATHGWTGCGYGPWRLAAPFAILDSTYTASRRLLDLPRDVPFAAAPLQVNWSPLNQPATGPLGADPASGLIGATHYDSSTRDIWVVGAANVDTDEFDREVVVHEWVHYFEDNFSRSDSPGGSHSFGYVLDPRLAFDEGSASGLAAALLDQPIYSDTYWNGTGLTAFGWDAETAPPPTTATAPNPADDPHPGPFSELSILRATWDLYDAGSSEAWDSAALGLGPLYDTFVGPQRTTAALTTVGSFVAGLKQTLGGDTTAISAVDAVLAHYDIGPITDDWGSGDASLAATYTHLAAPGATPLVQAATLSAFTCAGSPPACTAWAWNERPQNQYYVFTAAGTQATVTSTSPFDVDLEAYGSGALLDGAYGPTGDESITFPTTPGQPYVVVLTGWGGYASAVPSPGTYPATLTFTSP